jgi:hypothetical protein
MRISAEIVGRIGPEAGSRRLQEALAKATPARLQEWAGASGRQYLHLVYGLIDCPAVPSVNYVLARRRPDGGHAALKVGRASHDAPTLNLAQIRHEGAVLGADEVHIHVLAKTEAERILVEFDIAAEHADSERALVEATRH